MQFTVQIFGHFAWDDNSYAPSGHVYSLLLYFNRYVCGCVARYTILDPPYIYNIIAGNNNYGVHSNSLPHSLTISILNSTKSS